ncbi:aldo/keto reductase [Salinibius halmophilus]|uniref:aldo/keto reductase n=1 Tax=Salinibius halmophilus TaxID=1853216 RepID=UPI000E675E34|nr:aldo/keto reductase [Salinibius halmophilus]
MKLALGTAQFGLKYGISNISGRVPLKEVSDIVSYSREVGINYIDTASLYGCSEEVLGGINTSSFNIVTKFPAMPLCDTLPSDFIQDSLTSSLAKLRQESIYGALLHRPMQLLESYGPQLYSELVRQKRLGFIKNIGISIYSPAELDLLTKFDFDLVQTPMNILDKRLASSHWLTKLKEKGIEVHVRSCFLQGLLLMPKRSRPNYFTRWSPLFDVYDNWLAEEGISPIQACLGFLKSFPEIDKIVVGVESLSQLKQLISAYKGETINIPAELNSNDIDLIEPSRWKL